MGDNQDLKFVCKLCYKRYPCGKSLGGHMRSHVVATSSEIDEQMKKMESLKMRDQETRFEFGGSSSYGLRENPRKTWRAVGSSNLPMPQEKVCKQCGKVFLSVKALCGHMACHSDKDKGGGSFNLKDEHSWTIDSNSSDTDGEDHFPVMNNASASTRPKRYKKITHNNSSFTSPDVKSGSESASEVFEQDQEEVAKCLMMLSRDSGNWNAANSLMDSSDNNSVVLEMKSSSIDIKTPKKDIDESPKNGRKIAESQSSDSMYFLGEDNEDGSDVSADMFLLKSDYNSCKSKNSVEMDRRIKGYYEKNDYYEFGVESSSGKHDFKRKTQDSSYDPVQNKSSTGKKIKISFSDANKKKKKKKYECLNCKKIFSSYQALGGHRPCHNKRPTGSTYETGENSLDSPSYMETKVKTSNKTKGHKCPFCPRIFKSGQALGGHKRSHFIGGAEGTGHRTQVTKEAAKPELLDLNVAPIEDEDEQFM
ncbi:unnamed protein product [Cuscuta europaea]|nr:unnamed protein product [Cuscuta europaea]